MGDKQFWGGHWGEQKVVPPNNFAKRALVLMRKKRLKSLLDVGSGDGRDSLYFAGKGLSVTALDFSKSGIEKLKATNPKIKTQLADVRIMQFPRSSFDIIYAHLSLHYFTDADTTRIFKNLHRILKRGGLLFVKCKSIDDALYGKGKKVGPDMYRKGHTRHFFSKEYMAKQLQGFKILKLSKTSSTYHSYRSAFIEAVATK